MTRMTNGIFTDTRSALVPELGIVRFTQLESSNRCLSAHVIEGRVAIYKQFYISTFTSKVLSSF